ncbi:MAG: hypothetical protein RKK11_01565 [Alphaproteobacteria bacterium]
MAIGDRVFVDPIRSWGCWIDDSGDAQPFRVHDNDTDALAAPVLPLSDLGPDPFPGRSMSTLAFREFGMVRLERRAGALKIKFDLETVTMPSIGGARALMRAAFHSGPIDLIFRYGGWARERFYDVDKALSRVMQLCAHRGVEPETMIACDDHTLEDARTQAHPMIRRAINAWNRTDRRAIESFDSEFRKLTPYILTLSENNSIGNLSYRHVGGRSHIVSYLGREWARNVIGTLSNHGHCDTEFETAISEPYIDALDRFEPRYGHVRGLLVLAERDPEWVSYQRVILPYHTVRGKRAVAIMVAPDQNVSIPFLGLGSTR